ncbi:hypothetical protein B0T24DRAFT_551099, partial [Lasiosphaeria ovina]
IPSQQSNGCIPHTSGASPAATHFSTSLATTWLAKPLCQLIEHQNRQTHQNIYLNKTRPDLLVCLRRELQLSSPGPLHSPCQSACRGSKLKIKINARSTPTEHNHATPIARPPGLRCVSLGTTSTSTLYSTLYQSAAISTIDDNNTLFRTRLASPNAVQSAPGECAALAPTATSTTKLDAVGLESRQDRPPARLPPATTTHGAPPRPQPRHAAAPAALPDIPAGLHNG